MPRRALGAEPLHRIEERSKVGVGSANGLLSVQGGSLRYFVAPLVACLDVVADAAR